MQPQEPAPQDPNMNDGTVPGYTNVPSPVQNFGLPAMNQPGEYQPADQPATDPAVATAQPQQPDLQGQQYEQPGFTQPDGQYAQPGYNQAPQQNQNLAAQHFGSPMEQQFDTPKKSKAGLLFVSLAALVVVGLGATTAVLILKPPTPDSVFKAAVANSLSTKSVKQSLQTKEASLDVSYDFSKAADPRVDAHTKLTVLEMPFDIEQYATLHKGYVTYNAIGNLFTANPALASYKGKWMEQRSDGQIGSGSDGSVSGTFGFPDAGLYLFGDWIFGNFSAKDKTDLENYITSQKVYAYDASKVSKKQVAGENCYVYTVTVDNNKLLELNKKAAAIWGVSTDAAQTAMTDSSSSGKYTLSVGIKSKRLIQVDAYDKTLGENDTDKYSDYNSAKLPAEPTVQADFNAFNQAMGKVRSF